MNSELYSQLVMQSYINGTANILYIVIICIVTYLFYGIIKRTLENDKELEGVLLFVTFFISLLIILINLKKAVIYLLTPDYGVLLIAIDLGLKI